MKILVVGGGTAGFMAAMILKTRINAKVDLVYSKEIGSIGVGEGTTEHLKEFIDHVGIDQHEFIFRCDATCKAAIKYVGWTKHPYIHHVDELFKFKFGQYAAVYANLIINDKKNLYYDHIWDNKIEHPEYFLHDKNNWRFNQFHLNSFKTIEFLKEKSKEIKIKLFEDKIKNVLLNSVGEIDYLVGEKQEYHYDFYIDATGFKRILIEKMGAKWISYKDYLTMNSAFVFQTEDEEEYNLCTTSTAMNYGWMFKTPVWGRHGNGYIYDNNYTNVDKGKKEVEDLIKKEIVIGKEFNFDPGHLDKSWIKNCVAIGLSSNFIEPLEATSIGTTINQTFMLMQKIINYSKKDIELYNKSFNDICENSRDFVFLHYLTNQKETNFWKEFKNIKIPNSLKEMLSVWKNRLPFYEDFAHLSPFTLFKHNNFIVTLHGVNFFNKKMIKKEFDMQADFVKQESFNIIEEINNKQKNFYFTGHKNFLKNIREPYVNLYKNYL
jgi:hypothetical protein